MTFRAKDSLYKVNLELGASGETYIRQQQYPRDAHGVVARPGIQECHHESDGRRLMRRR